MDIKEIPEGICCVCGHSLDTHFDEEKGWRCHRISSDGYQCECWLRKHEYAETRDYYDLKSRYDGNEELQSLLQLLREDSDS